jgi:hypothetical protein
MEAIVREMRNKLDAWCLICLQPDGATKSRAVSCARVREQADRFTD